MKILLAEVVAQRHLLFPREAATLTLAVGREWDRRRARDADYALPTAAGIELGDAGDISFTGEPTGPADTGATLSTLSALLGQLLGVDEPEAPHQHVPGGLLITVAGRLGPLELPSSREDGFRSALLRFADDDPTVLVRVFDRIVLARQGQAADASEESRASKVRRGPERRRQPPAVAALRRAVRELERQTFEAKAVSTRSRRLPVRPTAGRRRATTALVAAAAAVVISAAGLLTGIVHKPQVTSPTRSTDISSSGSPVPVVRAEQPTVSIDPPATRVVTRRVTPRPPATSTSVRRTPPSPAAAQKTAAKQARVTFAGGSRAITWSRSTR